MKQYIKIIFVLGLGTLIGCQSIEHRSDTIKKNKLVALADEQTEVIVKKQWIKKFGKGVGKKDPLLMIAGSKDILVVADHEGQIYQVDKNNGNARWSTKLNKEVSAGPTISEDLVFVGTSGGEIIALSLTDGAIQWTHATTSEIVAAPYAKEGVLFAHSLDGGLTAINTQSGRQLWRYSSESPSLILRRSSPPAVGDERVIAGFANGKVISFRRLDGDIEWTREIALPQGHSEIQRMIDVSARPVIAHGNVYVVNYQGKVACLTLQTGEVLWERDFSSHAGLVVKGNQVLVVATNGEIWAFDAHNGGTLWMQESLRGRRLSAPVIHSDWFVVSDDDGMVHWLNADNGRFVGRSIVDKKGVEVPVIVDGQQVFVFGKSGKVTALYTQFKGQQGPLSSQT